MNDDNGSRVDDSRVWLLGALGALALRLLSASWRVNYLGADRVEQLQGSGRKVLLVCWHGAYLPLIALLRQHQACVLISDSFRGRVIAEICRRFACKPLIIPDGRPRKLELLIDSARDSLILAIAVDGPLGPFQRVKSGAVRLASALDFSVVPVAAAARVELRASWRWDNLVLPCPFTRVTLMLGPPLRIPPTLTRTQVQAWRKCLEIALHTITQQAASYVKLR